MCPNDNNSFRLCGRHGLFAGDYKMIDDCILCINSLRVSVVASNCCFFKIKLCVVLSSISSKSIIIIFFYAFTFTSFHTIWNIRECAFRKFCILGGGLGRIRDGRVFAEHLNNRINHADAAGGLSYDGKYGMLYF